mgnify:CR=1 FL=1
MKCLLCVAFYMPRRDLSCVAAADTEILESDDSLLSPKHEWWLVNTYREIMNIPDYVLMQRH